MLNNHTNYINRLSDQLMSAPDPVTSLLSAGTQAISNTALTCACHVLIQPPFLLWVSIRCTCSQLCFSQLVCWSLKLFGPTFETAPNKRFWHLNQAKVTVWRNYHKIRHSQNLFNEEAEYSTLYPLINNNRTMWLFDEPNYSWIEKLITMLPCRPH